MLNFLKKYIAIFIALFLLVYYILLSWLLHRTGFEHSEAMFVAEKIKLLFEAQENTLLTLGTTFPSLIFLSSVIFVPFGYPFAPVLASVSFTVLLFFFLLNDFSKSSMLPRRVFIPMILILFLFHPGLIYAAISGRGVGAILFFFYMVMRSLFKYYVSQTSFYLSMASIYLSCLVFSDYNFIWMLLAFFPFIFLVSLDGLKIAKDQPLVIQYFEALNNRSQRRKLANRTIALYIIIFLLPIGALYLFRTLNYTHAGDATYFLTSQYANWHVIGNNSVGNLIASGDVQNALVQSHIVFQVYVLLLTPMLLLVFFIFKGTIYELFTLLAPFILLSILLLDNQYYITVEYYLIFLVLGLLGIFYYAGKRFNIKYLYPIIIAVAILNVFTGIFYFKHSGDEEELAFFSSLKKIKNFSDERTTSEEYQLAAYISDIADDTHKILMDDAAAFRIMAHLRTLRPVIMPVNNNFITVAENPRLGAKFICVAKSTNNLRGFTVLNDYNIHQMELKREFKPVIMFETEHWAIYKII